METAVAAYFEKDEKRLTEVYLWVIAFTLLNAFWVFRIYPFHNYAGDNAAMEWTAITIQVALLIISCFHSWLLEREKEAFRDGFEASLYLKK